MERRKASPAVCRAKIATAAIVTSTISIKTISRRVRRLFKLRSIMVSSQLIANAVDGLQIDRLLWLWFDLLAQVHHMHIDGALEALVVQAKDQCDQFGTAEGASRFAGQRFQ